MKMAMKLILRQAVKSGRQITFSRTNPRITRKLCYRKDDRATRRQK